MRGSSILVAAIAVAAVAAVDLPDPIVNNHASIGLEIALEDMPGVQYRNITYTVNGQTFSGDLTQAGDGRWYHRNPSVSYNQGSFQYEVVAEHNQQIVRARRTIREAPSAAAALSRPRTCRGKLVMRDDFSGPNLNTNYWDYEVSMFGGYNWEIQVYTNDPLNVYQIDGHLFLRPTFTADKFGEAFLTNGKMDVTEIWGTCTNADRYGCVREGQYGLLPPIMSGKLKSKQTIRFGRVEVRARAPCGDWIWPALWMLPRNSEYGGWPRSGEIDIMESRGNAQAVSGGIDHGNTAVSSTMHWGPDPNQNRFYDTSGERRGGNFCKEFHTYTLDWTVDYLTLSVDGNQVLHVPIEAGGFWQKGGFSGTNLWSQGTKAAPFDKDFYMIMNVAVGGTNGFFPDDWQYNSPKPWSNNSPTQNADFWNKRSDWQDSWQGESVAMEIDYIQMRQY